MTTDKEHLQWIFDRLVNVHKENPNYDYMNRLKKIIETTRPVNVDLADVIPSACDDYIDGINMDCAKCGEPKYRHRH